MSEPLRSPHLPDCFYRVTVKGLYVKDGKVLFTHDFSSPRRRDLGGELELPGGGLDFGENFVDALKREVKEEMGLTVTHIDDKPTYVWTAPHGPGRKMDWYYVLVVVFRIELQDLNFTPSEECRDIVFLSKEDMRARLPELAEQIQPLAEHFNPKDFE